MVSSNNNSSRAVQLFLYKNNINKNDGREVDSSPRILKEAVVETDDGITAFEMTTKTDTSEQLNFDCANQHRSK